MEKSQRAARLAWEDLEKESKLDSRCTIRARTTLSEIAEAETENEACKFILRRLLSTRLSLDFTRIANQLQDEVISGLLSTAGARSQKDRHEMFTAAAALITQMKYM